MNQPIIIPLNKGKLFFGIGGSILFVMMGVGLINSAIDVSENNLLAKIVGAASILFFGATGIYGIVKLFDKKAGLIIDEKGITDHSNATSIGLIKWSDMTTIRVRQVMATKFLLIDIKNPETYLEKSGSNMQRKLMQANMKKYGTPITITSNTLSTDFSELEKMVQKKFAEYN